jgi:hypothetical protein
MPTRQTAKPAQRGFDRELAELEALSAALKAATAPSASLQPAPTLAPRIIIFPGFA